MRNRLSYRLENWPLLWVPLAKLGPALPLFVMMEVWQLELVIKAAVQKVIAVLETLRARPALLETVLVRPVEMGCNLVAGSCPS